jgi:hypothetical protein
MKERRTGPLMVALAMIPLLFFTSYIGSYYAMLEPEWKRPAGWRGPSCPRRAPWERPGYRVDGEFIENFYWPAYQLDQLVRPNPW